MACVLQAGKRLGVNCDRLYFVSSFELLSGNLPVENMQQPRTAIRALGSHAIAGLGTLLAQHLPVAPLFVMADENTWAAAGPHVEAQLARGMQWRLHLLGKRVMPTLALADEIATLAQPCTALLAVGSGSINDLAKYAAYRSGKPYAVVATAASMNGYTAANASLSVDGFKQSFTAAPPVLVVADSAIIAAAPKRLTRAGIGDTLCRSTVEADMLLSHLLFDTPYPQAWFDRLRAHEAELLTGLMKASAGEEAYIERLTEALLDAGDAMTVTGSSAVASQGEHMLAHTLELKYGSELTNVLHGELIAITTLTMSHYQHRMLLTTPHLKSLPYSEEHFLRQFGQRHGLALRQHYAQKLLDDATATQLSARVQQEWPDMSARLSRIMLPSNSIERAFIHSGLTIKPAQFGLAEERYRFATSYAHLTRARFTFLDLAAMNTKRMN